MVALIRTGALRGYRELMRSLGVDPLPLLRRQGVTPEQLDDEDALVPLHRLVALGEASALATRCPDFGLRLSASQDIRMLGPLALVLQNAPTIGEALQSAARYLYVHSPALRFSVRPRSTLVPGAMELRFEIDLPGQGAMRQSFDQSLGDTHRIVRFLAGDHYKLLAVALPHRPLAPLSTYVRFFGAPVHTEQEHAGLHVGALTLKAPLREVNEALRQMALEHITRHYGEGDDALAPRVRSALRQTLSNAGNKETITRLLNLHPRTLQRRLAAEGTSFNALREEVRREAAQRYLCETRVPMSQLAGLLGLSEQSALTRSCRRWFGHTPSAVRRGATKASIRRTTNRGGSGRPH
jgi:AraC-like DNA-binding protein